MKDPVLALAKDLVQLCPLEDVRLDNKTEQKELARVMRKIEELNLQMCQTLACTHLQASAALTKAIELAVKRAKYA